MTTITTEPLPVTIRALRVGPKKLTTTMYRQLESEPIIDSATGALRGQPWGRVNLHDTQCRKRYAPGQPHLHVVWATPDGDLRRTEGRRPQPTAPAHDRSTDLLTLLLADGWRPPDGWSYARGYSCAVDLGDGLSAIRCRLDAALPSSIAAGPPQDVGDAALAARAAAIDTAADELLAEVRADVTAQQAAYRRALESWHSLAALPVLIVGA